MIFLDRLQSLISGLGTSKDKTTTMSYTMECVNPEELNAMHRTDWIARKVVDIIPNDMTREWRDWQSDGDEIEDIENYEKRPLINTQLKVNEAMQKARLFGGAAIFIGTGETDLTSELKPERVGKDGLKYLHVLSRYDLTCGPLVRDVTSEFFGEPEYYDLVGKDNASVRVDRSRIVRFVGAKVLDNRMVDMEGWGDSILQVVYNAVQNATSVQGHVASLIPEAKTDVIYIPQLAEYLKNPTTTAQLTSRFSYANTMKSLYNMVLLQGNGGTGPAQQGESWEQKQINFSQLPELMQQFLSIVSGAADIPITRFLSQSPGGMNSTGDSDFRNYYDNIKSRQKTELQPQLNRLDEITIRAATGARNKSIYFEWSPLWGMTEKEKADVFKTKSDAARALVGSSGQAPLITVEALSDAIVNTFVEDGSLPGLEAAIKKHGDLSQQEEDPQDLINALPPEHKAALAAGQKAIALGGPAAPGAPGAKKPGTALAVRKGDAAPRPLYVRRDVVNAQDLIDWATAQGLKNIEPASELHVTIAYSRSPVDWMSIPADWSFGSSDGQITIPPGGPRMVDKFGTDAIVLMFNSSDLSWRHCAIIEAGASHDYPDYQPHITIAHNEGSVDLLTIEPYRGKIVLGPEIFEDIKP